METSVSEEEPRRRRGEETITAYNLLYSPCHICEMFVKAILKCLGCDYPRFQPINPPTQGSTDSEAQMKSIEDVGVSELSRKDSDNCGIKAYKTTHKLWERWSNQLINRAS